MTAIEPRLLTPGHLALIRGGYAGGYDLPEAVGLLLAHIAALEAVIDEMKDQLVALGRALDECETRADDA